MLREELAACMARFTELWPNIGRVWLSYNWWLWLSLGWSIKSSFCTVGNAGLETEEIWDRGGSESQEDTESPHMKGRIDITQNHVM